MIIIATGGLAQAGKTTLCETLDDHITGIDGNRTVERQSFAGPLRRSLEEVGVVKADHPGLYRRMAQWMGTDCLRADDPMWWVKMMDGQFKRLSVHETELRELADMPLELVVLIDDVRFQNEVDLIHRWGGQVIFVDAARRIDPPHEAWQQHPSEQLAIDYMNIDSDIPDETFDFSITNNATLEEFQDAVRRLYPELG